MTAARKEGKYPKFLRIMKDRKKREAVIFHDITHDWELEPGRQLAWPMSQTENGRTTPTMIRARIVIAPEFRRSKLMGLNRKVTLTIEQALIPGEAPGGGSARISPTHPPGTL